MPILVCVPGTRSLSDSVNSEYWSFTEIIRILETYDRNNYHDMGRRPGMLLPLRGRDATCIEVARGGCLCGLSACDAVHSGLAQPAATPCSDKGPLFLVGAGLCGRPGCLFHRVALAAFASFFRLLLPNPFQFVDTHRSHRSVRLPGSRAWQAGVIWRAYDTGIIENNTLRFCRVPAWVYPPVLPYTYGCFLPTL